jgi:iron complex outermembrane receptor protein
MKRNTIYPKKSCIILLSLISCFSLPTFGANTVTIPEVSLNLKNNTLLKQEPSIATTQFTKNDIAASPVVNLNQFLKQEQSVVRLTYNASDANLSAISIRGFGDNASANSLILVDGFLLVNPTLVAPNFNSIPLSDIERIDIYQGSEGSLWGSQAVGGVVNIVTKHPKKFFVNPLISGGSYGSFYNSIIVGGKADNGLFFKLFGIIEKTHNYRNQNKQNGNNFAVQIGRDYARGTTSFNVQTYTSTADFPGGLSEEQLNKNPRQATLFNNYSSYRTTLFQLFNTAELTERWLMETRIDHHATTGNGLIYTPFDSHDWLTTFNPRLIGSIKNSKIILGYAGQMSHYDYTNNQKQAKTNANQNDFYFQTTIPFNTQFDFILGAREAWQNNQSETQTRAQTNSSNRVFVSEQGLIYHPNQTISFFVRRDGNFSFPKSNEATWLPDNVSSLQTQTGVSYEAGSSLQTEKSKSQLSIYQLELYNEIGFDPTKTAAQPFGAYNNLDKTLRRGISVAENYSLTTRTTLNGQINYVNARFAAGPYAGKFIPSVPVINGNAGLSYHLTEHWVTQYTLLYTGSRYPSQDMANVSKKIPGYWLSDIALQYFMRSFNISFEVHNLFNKQYIGNAFYSDFTQKNIYYPAAERNYFLTLKINID